MREEHHACVPSRVGAESEVLQRAAIRFAWNRPILADAVQGDGEDLAVAQVHDDLLILVRVSVPHEVEQGTQELTIPRALGWIRRKLELLGFAEGARDRREVARLDLDELARQVS